MRKLFFLLAISFGLSGCDAFEFEDVEFITLDNFILKEVKGRNAEMEVYVTLLNPNFFGIKIKPSELDVYIDEIYAGKALLTEKVKLKKKHQQSYLAKIKLEGEDGILLRLMSLLRKKEIKLEVKGKVTGSVYGISKKVSVSESKMIETKKLREKLPF
ncbi:MAG: LEA14-like dessication related protein [Psychromonas sp.]|jgi:LEA14-like dessication related protein